MWQLNSQHVSRRDFAKATAAGVGLMAMSDWAYASADAPVDDPTAALRLGWTGKLKWGNVVDITRAEGDDWDAKFTAAQATVVAMGGGVVFFPAGTYEFRDHLAVKHGVILRGADPRGTTSAISPDYNPPSRVVFPRYNPILSGDGAPNTTAFKGIHLDDPGRASNLGVVNLSLDYGHIQFGSAENHACGSQRLVYGCVLRNAAVADPNVPYLDDGQHAWQRFTARHHAAIDVHSAEHVLIANNRLPKSGDANFVMPGYVLRRTRDMTPVFDVTFDYDNRPGLYINHFCVGGAGGSGNDGTPDSHPYGFRKGIVIVDNYVYNTGRMNIGFCGDGVICSRNVTRIEPDVWRPTVTGREMTSGSSTNDNRAIEMRGWRWTVEHNDCEVHRNWAADRKYYINDGEGLMHEDHCNSTVLDSRLVGNRVNSYLSIYKCGPIDGLWIEHNEVSVPGKISDIFVVANRNSGPQPCRNVTILKNLTHSNGIMIAGDPASNNVVRDNVHRGKGAGIISNEANATVEGNQGYATTKSASGAGS